MAIVINIRESRLSTQSLVLKGYMFECSLFEGSLVCTVTYFPRWSLFIINLAQENVQMEDFTCHYDTFEYHVNRL